MVLKPVLLALVGLFMSTAAQADAGGACVSLFARNPLENYNEINIEVRDDVAVISGRHLTLRTWTVFSYLRYTVRNNVLTLNYLSERPEYHGNRLFGTMVQAIAERNMAIQKVAVSITGSQFAKYRADLEATGNVDAAVKLNPVFAELDRAGFGNITFASEMNNPMQTYLRLVVSR